MHTRIGSAHEANKIFLLQIWKHWTRNVDWTHPKIYEIPLEEEIFWKHFYLFTESQLEAEGRKALKVSALVRELSVLHHAHFCEDHPSERAMLPPMSSEDRTTLVLSVLLQM